MNPELVAILNIAAFQSALVCELGFTACWCSGRVLVEESESPTDLGEVAMAFRKKVANLRTCPRHGASTHLAGARFCGRCRASLFDSGTGMPAWLTPATARRLRLSG